MPRHSLGMKPLSRYSLPFRIRLRTCFLAGAIAAGLCGVASPGRADAAPDTATIGAHVMDEYRSMSFDDTFFAVARGIRYEPYRGVLRGPVATALAQGGNAADQSLLLAELLKRKGYRVRFVQGVLHGDNLRTLLRGLYPPVLPEIKAPKRFNPYRPVGDKRLEEVAAAHVWLEVAQPGGMWLPLDPSFPRAKIGEAYAEANERFEQLPEAMYQRLRVSLHERLSNGTSRELGHVEGHVADLALRPMSYLVLSAPQMKRPPKKAKRGAADMFGGALSGADTKAKKAEAPSAPAKPVGIRYRRALFGGGVQQNIADTVMLYGETDGQLEREWLRFELIRPGQSNRIIERDTFLKGGPGDRTGVPAEYRRYSIAISAGWVRPDAVARYAQALGKETGVAGWRKRLDALSSEPASPQAAQRLSGLESSMAMLGGDVAAMSLSAEISELSRRLAFGNALTYAQTIPAITIISLEGDGKENYELGADLRLDEVEAWPYPGAPSRAVEIFQSARGIQGTLLEGFYVEQLGGKRGGANALSLLTATNEGPGRWLVFEPGEQARLSQITGLPVAVRRQLEATLERGREVIITAHPVELAGRPRFGWWERDRASGRVIGVMDDGRHGSMTEHSLSVNRIGLDDNTGYVIGLMVGATATEALLATKVLQEGTVTEKAIAEIKKVMERLQCMSCPKAEAKFEAEAKNSLSCFEVDKVTKFARGKSAKVELKFCENYVKGLQCASSMVLEGYKPTKGGWSYEVKGEIKVGCETFFSDAKKSTPADR